ncbi:MAG: hypothetical protein IPF92_13060 [Myxococcales bacterium]|nr:hypothetical protein [Myxococcales bacterium]
MLETEGEARQRLASLATEGYAGWLAQASFEQLRLVRDAIESLADVVRRGDVRTLKRAIKVLRDEDSIEGQRRRMAGWLEATFWETFRSSRGKPTLKLYSGTTRGADPEEEHAARCRHLRLAFVRDDEAWANLSDVDVREALDARKNVGVLYVLARLAVVAGVEKGPASESRFQSLARTYANAKKSGRQTKRGQEMTRVIK